MSDKITQIIPAPDTTVLVYLKENINFEEDSSEESFDLSSCLALALTEKGKVVGLDLNPETGCLEVPDSKDYMGLMNNNEDVLPILQAYFEKAKAAR